MRKPSAIGRIELFAALVGESFAGRVRSLESKACKRVGDVLGGIEGQEVQDEWVLYCENGLATLKFGENSLDPGIM